MSARKKRKMVRVRNKISNLEFELPKADFDKLPEQQRNNLIVVTEGNDTTKGAK